MEFLILIAVILFFFGPILGIAAIVISNGASGKINQLRSEIVGLKSELLSIKAELRAQGMSPKAPNTLSKPSLSPEKTENIPQSTATQPPERMTPEQVAQEIGQRAVANEQQTEFLEPSSQMPSISASAVPPTLSAKTPPPPQYGTRSSAGAPTDFPKGPDIDWEDLFAGKWAVWLGGAALSLASIFLVRETVEAGLFTPLLRIICAAIFGFGLIGGAFYTRDKDIVTQAEGAFRYLPAILASSGVIALYGTALAGGVLFNLYGPMVVFALLGGVSLLSILLGLLFGPVIAGMGLAGSYISPLLTGAEGGSPIMILPYAALVSFAGLAFLAVDHVGRKYFMGPDCP